MGLFDKKHSIGKTIAELRKAKGWTQIELAEKLNVSDKAVSKWEQGNGSPSIEFFPALAQLFDVSIDYLMTGVKDKKAVEKKERNMNVTKAPAIEYKTTDYLIDGIVDIDKLLGTKDLAFVKKMLQEHPIHQIEVLKKYLDSCKMGDLYRYAIDNNDINFAEAVIRGDAKEIERNVYFEWRRAATSADINKNYLKNVNIVQANSVGKAIEQLQKIKQGIINDLSLKLDKDITVGNLTKEYFENELAKGNTDMVVIKLCVRLEAILRSDFHYDGEFSEMLKKYCDTKLHWREDDGWGYMVNRCDEKTIRLLNNLRIKRNSIVHSEKTSIELSWDDLQYCIEYICELG